MHQVISGSWLIFDVSSYTYPWMGIIIICISLMFVIMWYLYLTKYSQRFRLFWIWLYLSLFGIRVEGLRNAMVLVVTNVKQVLQFHHRCLAFLLTPFVVFFVLYSFSSSSVCNCHLCFWLLAFNIQQHYY